MSVNANAVSNDAPVAGSHVAPQGPLTTKGVSTQPFTPMNDSQRTPHSQTPQHQPGHIASEADAAPEFHAQVLPAGSAPTGNTFKPNPIGEVPGQSADNYAGQGGVGTTTSAQDTITGASSSDVHKGMGHPGQGQSSKELHDNSTGGGAGLQGVGAESAPAHGIDARENKDFSQVGSHGAAETKVAGQKGTQDTK